VASKLHPSPRRAGQFRIRPLVPAHSQSRFSHHCNRRHALCQRCRFGTTTSFGGTATFSGSTVHTGHATFTSATISSNLNVSGAGSLSTLAASGAANFSSTLGVTGIATFSKVLQINAGSATISYLRAGTGQWATYNDGGDGDSFKVLDVINGTGAKVVKASPGWLSMSDRRAKTNIAELAVLNKVADFRAVSFTWKKTGKRGIGVIAQELYSLFPELVGVGSDDDAPFAGGLSDPGAWTVAESHLGAIALQG
jgi:Chaperone of endosialidase